MALEGEAIFVCSSDYMKNLILQLFPSLLGRIEVVPCTPQVLSTILCDNCSGCDLSKSSFVANNYFIAVGTIEPRKNYSLMIEGWKAAKKQPGFNSQLLIVGGKGWKCRRLLNSFRFSNSMLKQDIIWLDSCCDGALALFYANSKAFISTSLDEGFNLPAMEAREFFCIPLILSNIPVHRELHSHVAYFFDGLKEFINIICSFDFEKARKFESFETRNTPINDMKMVIYKQIN
jgi:glycosyltransferase involved in cell wall biosynthesis